MQVFGPKLLSYEPRQIQFLDECLSSPEIRPFDNSFMPIDEFLNQSSQRDDKTPKRYSLFRSERQPSKCHQNIIRRGKSQTYSSLYKDTLMNQHSKYMLRLRWREQKECAKEKPQMIPRQLKKQMALSIRQQ